MNSILGLPDFEKFKAAKATRTSHRRQILHAFPQGGSTLTGILSMTNSEEVESVEHTWYSKIYVPPRFAGRGTNVVTVAAPSTGDANDGTALGNGATAVTVAHFIKVSTTERITPGHIIRVSKNGLQLRVVDVVRGVTDAAKNGYVKAYPVRAYTRAATDIEANDIIEVIGSAHGEGAVGGSVKPTAVRLPYSLMNQTQIFRTAKTFPGTVLKQGLEFDKSGPYKEAMFDTSIDHFVDIEMSLLFGRRSTTVRPSLVLGEEDEVVRTMSGILEYLELWDAGATGLDINGVNYAPFAKFPAATTDADDRKRIIDNSGGAVDGDKWNVWAERVGRYHTNKTNEKLVLCGSGAINAFHKMFRNESQFNVTPGNKAYGLGFTTYHSPYGDFHFTVHPLFNENPVWRNWCLILDVQALKFRPLTDRDTKLLKNRQGNGDDRRKDEFLTEALIEFWHPHNHMLIKNVYDYTTA